MILDHSQKNTQLGLGLSIMLATLSCLSTSLPYSSTVSLAFIKLPSLTFSDSQQWEAKHRTYLTSPSKEVWVTWKSPENRCYKWGYLQSLEKTELKESLLWYKRCLKSLNSFFSPYNMYFPGTVWRLLIKSNNT